MDGVVGTAGLMVARINGCVATSLRKGAGNERRVFGRIVGGVAWHSQQFLRTWSM